MQQKISLRILPADAADDNAIKKHIALVTGNSHDSIYGYHILKQSIDARGKQAYINLTINAFINEPVTARELMN
jgi:uncharacterized protein